VSILNPLEIYLGNVPLYIPRISPGNISPETYTKEINLLVIYPRNLPTENTLQK